MTVNSRIRNLHKAIDWIKEQSLGLRHEAIVWTKRQSIGSNRLEIQAIDWIKANRLVDDQALGSLSSSLEYAVTGRMFIISYSSILLPF